MYSVVLMMALSGGAESADFGRRGCHGCDGGCHGKVAASCHGRSRDCHGGRVKKERGHRCHGSSACHGGGRAACHGGRGCHGGRAACHGRSRGHRCHGGAACHGCHGAAPACHGGCTGGAMVPGGPPPKMMPKEKVPTPPAKTQASAPATIVVTLPADARLTVDGNATASTSERRTFITPVLETGADYVYTMTAEVIRDGRAVIETQTVTVRGGETTDVPFNFSTQGVASR